MKQTEIMLRYVRVIELGLVKGHGREGGDGDNGMHVTKRHRASGMPASSAELPKTLNFLLFAEINITRTFFYLMIKCVLVLEKKLANKNIVKPRVGIIFEVSGVD